MDPQLNTFGLTLLLSTFILALIGSLSIVSIYYYRTRKIELLRKLKNSEFEYSKKLLETELSAKEFTSNSISRELHDNIGHSLTLLKLRLFKLDQHAPSQIKPDLSLCYCELTSVIDSIRTISRRLSSDYVLNNGILEILTDDIIRLNELQTIKFTLRYNEPTLPLERYHEAIVYQILQECINNVIKHSQATKCTIQFEIEETTIKIIVLDDGIGLKSEKNNTKKNGLFNINKCASLINGEVSFVDLNPGFLTNLKINRAQ